MSELFDVTIIGGGPAGLYASYYAGFRALRTKIIDNLPELGGQVTALYPEKYILDVAGFPRIQGKDLIKNLCDQAMQYEPAICLDEKVECLTPSRDGQPILVKTNKAEHFARTLLLTSGVGMFRPKKVLAPEAEKYEGKGLSLLRQKT